MDLAPPKPKQTKIQVVGSGGVGKSTIIIQMVHETFVEEYDPTIENQYRIQKYFDEDPCTLSITDTAGEEEYSAIRDHQFRDHDGFVFVFSATNRGSLNDLADLRLQIQRVLDVDDFPVVIVGNKIDLEYEREVGSQEGETLAKQWNCQYIECSAKTRTNIEEIFYHVYHDIQNRKGPSDTLSEPRRRNKCIVS